MLQHGWLPNEYSAIEFHFNDIFKNSPSLKIKEYHRLGIEIDEENAFQDVASLPNCFGKIDVVKHYHILFSK